jgi:hypothetical protein
MGKGKLFTTNGPLTASGVAVDSGPGWLRDLHITVTNAIGEVLVYDNASASSGTLLADPTVAAAAAAGGATSHFFWPGAGVYFENGLYIVLSGGTTSVQPYWDR